LHGGIQIDGIAVLVHDTIVVGPVVATSLSVAKFLASERALMILSDATSEKSLSRLCICGQIMEVDIADGVPQADSQEETSVAAKEADLDDLSERKDLEEIAGILTQVDLADDMD
jgi:endoribonuclease Dicer